MSKTFKTRTKRFYPHLTGRIVRVKLLFMESVTAWVDHRAASKGAALAFYTLFSMTPILVLIIAIASHFLGAENAQNEVFEKLQEVMGVNGTEVLRALLRDSSHSDSSLLASVIAGALMLLGASSVFVELKDSLDEMWGKKTPRHSAFWGVIKSRLLSFAIILILTFLLLMSLMISATLAVVERYASDFVSNAAFFSATLTSLLSFAITASLFVVIFKSLPDTKLAWSDVWIGAFFTAGLFSLGKYGIGIYLSHSAISSSFGAAGSVIALLLWIYYCAQIFFMGAEFTRQYALIFGSLCHASASDLSSSNESKSLGSISCQ